jgi:hypothetical protein
VVIDFTCRGRYEPAWAESEWIEIDEPAESLAPAGAR